MTITHLVTHSGGFHADELLSSVVLTRLFPQARLLRTRAIHLIVTGQRKREVLREAMAASDPLRHPIAAVLRAGRDVHVHWSP